MAIKPSASAVVPSPIKEQQRADKGETDAAKADISQLIMVVEKEKTNLAQSKEAMSAFSTAPRVYRGKKRLPLEIYEASCLARIAELEQKMLVGVRRSPLWCR